MDHSRCSITMSSRMSALSAAAFFQSQQQFSVSSPSVCVDHEPSTEFFPPISEILPASTCFSSSRTPWLHHPAPPPLDPSQPFVRLDPNIIAHDQTPRPPAAFLSNFAPRLLFPALLSPEARHVPRSCTVATDFRMGNSVHGIRSARKARSRLRVNLGVYCRGASNENISLHKGHSRSNITRCSYSNHHQRSLIVQGFADVSCIGSSNRSSDCNFKISKLEQLASIACEVTKRRRSPRKSRRNFTGVAFSPLTFGARTGTAGRIVDATDRGRSFQTDHRAASWRFRYRETVDSTKVNHKTVKAFGRILISTGSPDVVAAIPKRSRLFCKWKTRPAETRVERCAKHVLKFVGEDVTTEKVIRQALGNNPDTSKALRLLLNQRRLRRFGGGGRRDPYMYKATQIGLQELTEEVSTATSAVL